MGFMSRYSGTDRIDVTDLADPDGTEYWIEVRRSLTGDQWDRADAAHMQAGASVTQNASEAGRAARRQAARRRSGQATAEDDAALNTLIKIDNASYRRAVLDFAVVDWNLTNEYGMKLPLEPAERREQSIALLPPEVRTRIVEHVEASKTAERDATEEAEFPGDVQDGGAGGQDGASADPGTVDAGGVVVAHWADAGAGV